MNLSEKWVGIIGGVQDGIVGPNTVTFRSPLQVLGVLLCHFPAYFELFEGQT